MPNTSPAVDQSPASVRRTLRRLYLTLFLRGRGARGVEIKSAPRSIGRKLSMTLFWHVLMGCMALMLRGQSVYLLSAYLHGLTLAFLGLIVASSAGELLFNQDESEILLHRPIEPRTLLWAKVSVLAEISLWLAGAFNLVGFFVGATASDGGWVYFPVHAASVALQAFFCTGCVVLVYQLCLRWFGRERLDGLMTTAQVVLTLAAVLSGQLVPQLLASARHVPGLSGRWSWLMALPPAWFAGIDDALAGSGSAGSWILGGAALLATGGVLWLSIQKLSDDYQTGLQRLNEHSRRSAVPRSGRRWLDRAVAAPPLRWWLRQPQERAAFLLAAAYLMRDRDVKLRVYPAVAPIIAIPVVMMAREIGRGEAHPASRVAVAFGSAYIALVPLLAINLLQFSQHWMAADVFRSAPLPGPAALCHGARKAVLSLLAIPVLLVLAGCTWFIQRDPASLILLLPGLIALPVVALVPNRGGRSVLLSQPVDGAKSASRGALIMATMVVTMALSGLAAGAQAVGWLGWTIVAETVIAAAVYVWMCRSLDRAPWPEADASV